jgi:hypothetical protein
MKKSVLAAFALSLVAGISQVAVAAPVAQEAPAEGLVEIKKGAFQSTWINPDVDFRQYNRVVIVQNGHSDYRDVGPVRNSRSQMLRSNEREFAMSEADRERFERIAGDSFTRALARSKHYEIIDDLSVEVPVSGTLVLRGHLLDVVSNVPPPMAGSSSVYSNVMGEATLILELIDAESGKVVAYAAERSRIQRSGSFSVYDMTEVNSVTALAEVRRWASRAGNRLARGLDDEHKV